MTARARNWLLPLILAVAALTFSNSLSRGYFNWDDPPLIVNNTVLTWPFWDALKAAFTQSFIGDYLPLTIMSFWAEAHAFGLHPGAQHAVNLFLHLLNVTLLFWYLKTLKFDDWFAYGAAAFFAFHPVNTEPLMWTSNRNILLCTAFIFSSCLFEERARRSERKKPAYVLMGACYLGAFFCKSTGILLPVYFIIKALTRHREPLKNALARFAPLIVVMPAAILIRSHSFVGGKESKMAVASALDTWRLSHLPLIIMTALFRYLKMLFTPFSYALIYPHFDMNFETVLGALVVISVIALIAVLYRRTKNPDYILFSSFAIVFLFPVLQVFPLNNYISDRYVYLPLTGFIGLFLLATRDLKLNRFWWAGVVALMALPALSYERTLLWKSDVSIWNQTVKVNPESALALNNLGFACKEAGDLKGALESFERALKLTNFDIVWTQVYNNAATIYMNPQSGPLFNPEKAIELFSQGLANAPYPEAAFELRFNLGLALGEVGRQGDAMNTWRGLLHDLEAYPGQHDLVRSSAARELAEMEARTSQK